MRTKEIEKLQETFNQLDPEADTMAIFQDKINEIIEAVNYISQICDTELTSLSVRIENLKNNS